MVMSALVTLAILVRRHYTSWPLYWENVAQRGKMSEMRDEQWDAIDDANHREGDE
jgi:hypothetical protein